MSFQIDDDLIEKVARQIAGVLGDDPDAIFRGRPLWERHYAQATQALIFLAAELPRRGYVITKAGG